MATSTSSNQQTQPKWLSYVMHGLSGLLTLGFLVFGGTKLAGQEMHIENFARWGYPNWFVYVTGGIEVLGAILVIIPKTRFYGAALLAVTMVGAIGTHIIYSEFGAIPFPAVLLVLSMVVAWFNKPAMS